jgi:hypothetical protein
LGIFNDFGIFKDGIGDENGFFVLVFRLGIGIAHKR